MDKKYRIVNLNYDDNCVIFNILYIVLIFVIIFIVYKIIYNFYYRENFENISTKKKLTSDQILQELKQKNNELTEIKNTLQNKLKEQSIAVYISDNYDKVDSSSFDDELSYLLLNFANTKLPSINMEAKTVIQSQSQLNSILSEARNMKNFYNPGDIVTKDSTFGINKHDICYRSNGKPIKTESVFMEKYPDCMVCSVENPENLYNSGAWNTTRTNINQVCLYNTNSEDNFGVPNLEQCQNFCGLNNNNIPQQSLINTVNQVAK